MSKTDNEYPVQGAGLGLRRGLMDQLMADPPDDVDFMEVAPENWIRVGGKLGRKFRWFTERYPFVLHGLSLSIGAPSPLNEALLRDVREFMELHGIEFYSEHLSYCGDDGQLYDLMPIPFTGEAATYVAERIRRAQDILGRRMAVENVSYYTPTDTSLTEAEFTNAVLEQADCDLLLDINNIIVNSINHGYDAREFMLSMPKRTHQVLPYRGPLRRGGRPANRHTRRRSQRSGLAAPCRGLFAFRAGPDAARARLQLPAHGRTPR